MTEHMREFSEHHPDGEFRRQYLCAYCEEYFMGLSADDCPWCKLTEKDWEAYKAERYHAFDKE